MPDENDVEDFGNQPSDVQSARIAADPDPNKVLGLARETLAGLAAFAIISEGAYCGMTCAGYGEQVKVFETLLLTVLPSLVTLIVGFYFGKKTMS